MNKDEVLTYEELTTLCKKQEEHIKELENKIYGTLSDTEKWEPAKPDYETLCRKVQSLDNQIFKLKKENEALRDSLTRMYISLEGSQSREEMWEEVYYKENRRANKLYDELHQEKL